MLALDDDAIITDPQRFRAVVELITTNTDIIVLSLNVLMSSFDMKEQYFSNFGCEGREIFPIPIPGLGACLIKVSPFLKAKMWEKLFFVDKRKYGGDEFALAIRCRLLGYQIFGTRTCFAIHRHNQLGRSRKICVEQELANCDALAAYPRKFGIPFVLLYQSSLLMNPDSQTLSRVKGSLLGIIEIIRKSSNIRRQFFGEIGNATWKRAAELFSDAYISSDDWKTRLKGKIMKICSRLIT